MHNFSKLMIECGVGISTFKLCEFGEKTMAELIKIAVDAMGGDNAPAEIIKGCIDALSENDSIHISLVGISEVIEKELSSYQYDNERIEIVNATEVIEMAEPPVNAIRKKKDSSIVVGMNLVKNGECQAFVSAGSTGAVLVGGQVIVGRIKGVERPPLAPLVPTTKGFSLIVDCGANVDAKPSQLVQFAKMGSLYMKSIMGIENPTVGIVNVGAEEEKGNALVKETFPLLKKCPDINFTGSIEAREIPFGQCDVIVCDAFVGNVIIKMYEGVSSALVGVIKESLMSSAKTKIGGALIKTDLKKTLKNFSASEYGGAPLLGLKGLVVKAHGNSKSYEFKRALMQCVSFAQNNVNEQIKESLSLSDIQDGN